MNFENLIGSSEVIICVGSGGVGKTTVAASIGIKAAQSGKRVLVLTIDPSKRLATTLGIGGKKDIAEVPQQKYKGKLFASVVDHKSVFDEFVIKAAQKTPAAEKILKNKLYIQLSTQMSGSQEFTSLQKLYSAYESKEYNLIILDTPPAKHAMDFLKSPEKLSNLFSENVMRWLSGSAADQKGFWTSLMQSGTKKVFGLLEKITGSDFIAQLVDFFSNISGWHTRINSRLKDIQNLLKSESTQFVLVTSSNPAKAIEAENLLLDIKKTGHHVSAIIFNQVFPDWISHDSNLSPELAGIYFKLKEYFIEKNKISLALENKYAKEVDIVKIPDMNMDLSNLKGLETLCDIIH